jgi:hypothetical protein
VRRVFGPRFLLEVALIVAAAVAGVVADLPRLWVFVVIWAAWLLVVAVEWAVARRRRERYPTRGGPEPEPEVQPEVEDVVEPKQELEPEPGPEPEPEPERPPVATPPPPAAAVNGPRTWNLWDLERIARDHAGGDVARDEELSFLLMYLREFAGPDGLLPAEFDGLVRDSFGDLLGAGRA